MDNLEKLTRELGAEIQKDERYLKFIAAKEANDKDVALGELMGKLQLIQISYQHESSKEEPNEGKLKAYDEEFRGVYAEVMQNKNMRVYEMARKDIDDMMNYLTGILALCVNGDDPATCDPNAHNDSCGGDCSCCGGECDCNHE